MFQLFGQGHFSIQDYRLIAVKEYSNRYQVSQTNCQNKLAPIGNYIDYPRLKTISFIFTEIYMNINIMSCDRFLFSFQVLLFSFLGCVSSKILGQNLILSSNNFHMCVSSKFLGMSLSTKTILTLGAVIGCPKCKFWPKLIALWDTYHNMAALVAFFNERRRRIFRRERVFRDRTQALDTLSDRDLIARYRFSRDVILDIINHCKDDIQLPTNRGGHVIPPHIQVCNLTIQC
jgi:hypothetical protein